MRDRTEALTVQNRLAGYALSVGPEGFHLIVT